MTDLRLDFCSHEAASTRSCVGTTAGPCSYLRVLGKIEHPRSLYDRYGLGGPTSTLQSTSA